MKKVLFTGLVFLSFITAYSQKSGAIKGIAYDSIAKQPVANATITVLQKKDSSLISFTMTDNLGRFEITSIPNGAYRLLITHVSYHNSSRSFIVSDEHKTIDLGTIILYDKSTVLKEVIIEAEASPVTMVG